MTEQEAREFLASISDFRDEEKRELLRFIEMLNNGLVITKKEAYEMGRRIISQQ